MGEKIERETKEVGGKNGREGDCVTFSMNKEGEGKEKENGRKQGRRQRGGKERKVERRGMVGREGRRKWRKE